MERNEIEAALGKQRKYFHTGATLPVTARKAIKRHFWICPCAISPILPYMKNW